MDDELKPCPFCGGTETRIDVQSYWTGMRSETVSVTVKHWCARTELTPLTSLLQLKAKTAEKAIELWNTRAQP